MLNPINKSNSESVIPVFGFSPPIYALLVHIWVLPFKYKLGKGSKKLLII